MWLIYQNRLKAVNMDNLTKMGIDGGRYCVEGSPLKATLYAYIQAKDVRLDIGLFFTYEEAQKELANIMSDLSMGKTYHVVKDAEEWRDDSN